MHVHYRDNHDTVLQHVTDEPVRIGDVVGQHFQLVTPKARKRVVHAERRRTSCARFAPSW
jgi:hypothetical protein